jgi:DNA-binding GntR family transcriptional regulator
MAQPIRSTSSNELPKREMRRESVRQLVSDYLKELIFEGKLRPGDRVPQDEVASALGVSNTPVREALIALEHEGLVRIELHRGAFVNTFDAESVRGQYELFALVWGWAIRRSVPLATPEFTDALIDIGRRAKDADPDEMYQLVSRVTDMFQEVGGRDWRRLLDALPRLVPPTQLYALVPGVLGVAASALEPMARAVKRGDADKASAIGERMMVDHGEALIRELERLNLIGSSSC